MDFVANRSEHLAMHLPSIHVYDQNGTHSCNRGNDVLVLDNSHSWKDHAV